jgi:FKBP-type peptidyl-prolyl cis-trans isomerase (trigger factor)
MNKTISSVVVLVVVVAVGWYFLSGHTNFTTSATGVNDTVATVNGSIITRGQLTTSESQLAVQQGMSATSTAVRDQFQSSALDSLIEMVLIEQVAEKAGVTASSTEVDAQLASMKGQFSTSAEYEAALSTHGITEPELLKQISQNFVINAYLEQQLHLASMTATDAEIQTAYDLVASQQGTSTPPLSQVRSQVAQMVVREKQRTSVNDYIAKLRSAADIKILIATSTPIK